MKIAEVKVWTTCGAPWKFGNTIVVKPEQNKFVLEAEYLNPWKDLRKEGRTDLTPKEWKQITRIIHKHSMLKRKVEKKERSDPDAPPPALRVMTDHSARSYVIRNEDNESFGSTDWDPETEEGRGPEALSRHLEKLVSRKLKHVVVP